ncbi:MULTISPECIES: ABC transporter substrate-binding protein [Variovorax]|uniref:ABC transporter substrate-binding protein n=1 Tax=Variovorax TaxID=34072 RepID=UPI000A8E62D0|nr:MULTISPECIES: ABC transporter substrate-binding protein [Variovorax]UKI11908.1 ABC transporter substrate-binding protein [Variovorax paradoxus]
MALVTSGLSALPAFAAGDFPREVTDALGRRVRIAAPPQRIVVVFPSNVELAWALGLEDRVAAIGGRVRWPESARAKPSIGGSLGYSAEAVAAYRPDLVVVTPSHYSALGLVEAFERVQVPSVVLAHPDLPSVFRNIELLGRATGTEEAARQLRAGMEARLQAVSQALDGAPRRSVYLETAAAARGAFQTMGTGHYANDALQWAGGRNVFADLQGSQQVSAEAIFVRDPDVIISLQQVPKDPALIAERPGWHSLRAVKNGRVVVLERSHKLIPGPRQIEAVEQYARALHPERFA